jgi:hypothetical protein
MSEPLQDSNRPTLDYRPATSDREQTAARGVTGSVVRSKKSLLVTILVLVGIGLFFPTDSRGSLIWTFSGWAIILCHLFLIYSPWRVPQRRG